MNRRSDLAGKIIVEFGAALILWYTAHHMGIWVFAITVTAGAVSGHLTGNWVCARREARRDAR